MVSDAFSGCMEAPLAVAPSLQWTPEKARWQAFGHGSQPSDTGKGKLPQLCPAAKFFKSQRAYLYNGNSEKQTLQNGRLFMPCWCGLHPVLVERNQVQCHCLPVLLWFICSSCLTLCDPTDCSIPGFPVLHSLPEFAQAHVR